jgi:hypothetical protein
MRRETELSRGDHPGGPEHKDLIDADFTFVNERRTALRHHRGDRDEFRRVNLAADPAGRR